MKNIRMSQVTDLIMWLNSLRSVTDFETSALFNIQEVCIANGIRAKNVDGGLLIGNPDSHIVLMAHIDRIGFVAINGRIEVGSIIDLKYIANPTSIPPNIIEERFSKILLVGYNPIIGEDLFIAYLIKNDSNYFQAQICHVFNTSQKIISFENPIPLTAVKSQISQIGEYLQGYFDNSAGLAIALSSVAKYPEQFSCIITGSEEGGGYQNWPTGGRGAQKYIRNHDLRKILVVIDVRPAELIESDEIKNCVGKGVVFREAEYRKDNNGKPSLLINADKEILTYIKNFVVQNNIQYQTFDGTGITEAGRAYEVLGQDAKLRCIWLQPPIANEHTQFEIVSLADIEDTLKIIEGLKEL